MNKSSNPLSNIEYALIIVFLILCVYALVDKVKSLDERKTTASMEIKVIDDKNSDLNSLKQEVKKLYNSLLTFKDNSDFHTFGFGIGYKYNKWLKDIENLESTSRQKQLFIPEFSVGDLKMLGLEYVKTQGRENDFTKWVRKRLDNGLHH